MPIDLARLPVEISFILAHAGAAHEFERDLQVRKADRHRATSKYLIGAVETAPERSGIPTKADRSASASVMQQPYSEAPHNDIVITRPERTEPSIPRPSA